MPSPLALTGGQLPTASAEASAAHPQIWHPSLSCRCHLRAVLRTHLSTNVHSTVCFLETRVKVAGTRGGPGKQTGNWGLELGHR